MDSRTKALCDFLDASHSVYHAQAYLAETLKNAGYTRLYEQDEWALAPGGKYFLTRGGSALVAFRVPQGSPKGFLMSAAIPTVPPSRSRRILSLPPPTPAWLWSATAEC